MSKTTVNLGWSERVALVNHYNVDDETAARVFGTTTAEVTSARNAVKSGLIPTTTDLNVEQFKGLFQPNVDVIDGGLTATSTVRVAQKRGRKGDKVLRALSSITETPVSVDSITAEFGISVNVLRQANTRFSVEKRGPGKIVVKKNTDGVLMISRVLGE